MIGTCFKYGCDYELKYNITKNECMIVKAKWLKHLKIPDILLGGQNFTGEKKYPGCFICDNLLIILIPKTN